MKANLYVALSLVTVASCTVLAANADTETYSSTRVEESAVAPTTVTREEVRTEQTSPVVIREQPVIVQPVENKTVVIKKRKGHLIQVGPLKVF